MLKKNLVDVCIDYPGCNCEIDSVGAVVVKPIANGEKRRFLFNPSVNGHTLCMLGRLLRLCGCKVRVRIPVPRQGNFGMIICDKSEAKIVRSCNYLLNLFGPTLFFELPALLPKITPRFADVKQAAAWISAILARKPDEDVFITNGYCKWRNFAFIGWAE